MVPFGSVRDNILIDHLLDIIWFGRIYDVEVIQLLKGDHWLGNPVVERAVDSGLTSSSLSIYLKKLALNFGLVLSW